MPNKIVKVKIEVKIEIVNIVRASAPQVGGNLEYQKHFWSALNNVMQSISKNKSDD